MTTASFSEPLTRPKNDTLQTSCSRRLMEHKLNRLSGSSQHGLALKVLASPQRSMFTARAALSASGAACCCGHPCSMTVRCLTAASTDAVSGQRPHRRPGTCCSDRSLISKGNGLCPSFSTHGHNACRSLLRVDRFSASIGLVRFQKKRSSTAFWLAHADDQGDEFALGTVNATMAHHDGQCQVLLTSCSASSAIVLALTNGRQQASITGLCHRPASSCSLLGLHAPVSRGPDLSWDSRRALHRSPPNEFDSHDPSGRRLLGQFITM